MNTRQVAYSKCHGIEPASQSTKEIDERSDNWRTLNVAGVSRRANRRGKNRGTFNRRRLRNHRRDRGGEPIKVGGSTVGSESRSVHYSTKESRSVHYSTR